MTLDEFRWTGPTASGYRSPWEIDDGPDLYDERFNDDEEEFPPPDVGLDAGRRRELAAHIEATMAGQGCDGTLRAAQRWATTAGVPWVELKGRLQQNGGFCDCEVLFNVPGLADGGPD
ncbi:uncharacterized protein DUF2695 [Pseudonocardia sediminis]|uniref:Uncharacterized protein DUF2695 n=1 Tax=Pseudonocardia sediminis TaxID=1397368 RepID=A0A4Q7UZE4_PSEST|nr:DUF2695 domain-containing protein [Pseudonocardia sediminis]RZT87165.1 uncharacterized protein DUF2695 [Pseudonocardia sediminis]